MNALMKIAQLALLLLICSLGSVLADVKPPGIVIDGLDTYYNYGSKAASDFWLKDSALGNIGLEDKFAVIEQKFGRMLGFEIMSVVPVSASLVRVYILMKYEKGPAFLVFDCYKPNANWIISRLDCDTKAELIIPQRLLLDGRK